LRNTTNKLHFSCWSLLCKYHDARSTECQNVKNESMYKTIQVIEDNICQINFVFQYFYVETSAGCVLIRTCVFDPTGHHFEMQHARRRWHIRYLFQNYLLAYSFFYNVIIFLKKKSPSALDYSLSFVSCIRSRH
jgi:hypothetical protein